MAPFASHRTQGVGAVLEPHDVGGGRALDAYVLANQAALLATVARGLGHDLRNALQLVTFATAPPRAREVASAKLEGAIGVIDRLAGNCRETAPVCVADLLAEVDAWQRRQTGLPPASFAIACDERLPAVAGRADDLLHALLALVTNAKEAMPDGQGTVRITAAATATGAEITIEDSGVGIPRRLRDRVCEPFVTTKASTSHIGLGLTASRTLIERAAGALTLSSTSGGGLRAVVSLARWRKPRERDSR